MAQSANIQKVSGWHERLADWLILHPTLPQSEAAREFGVTQSWLSVIINSDAFQDHFRKKSQAHSEALLSSVREKTLGLADQAISKLSQKVEQLGDELTIKDLVEISDMALKRTGHGEPRQGPAPVQVNIGVVTRDQLAQARDAMRNRPQLPSRFPEGLEGPSSNVIDLHPVKSTDGGS